MEDDHDAILKLGGQVEGESGPRETGVERGHPNCHVVQDVLTWIEFKTMVVSFSTTYKCLPRFFIQRLFHYFSSHGGLQPNILPKMCVIKQQDCIG